MRSGTVALGLAATVITLACACSSNTPGIPQPANTTSNHLAEPGGAPKIKTPLDTTRWQHDPCSVIPAATLSQLGVTTSGQPDSARPGCQWFIQTSSGSEDIGIQFVTDAPHGLSTIYLNRSNTTRFQPFTADGYPGLIYRRPTDQPGDCSAAIGVTDKLYYEADAIDLISTPDPCSVAKTVATEAMVTMTTSR